MLGKELESRRKRSQASGNDGESTRRFDGSPEAPTSEDDGRSTSRTGFGGSSEASDMPERSADCGGLVQGDHGKVTASVIAAKAREGGCNNFFSFPSDSLVSAQRSQGIIIGQSDSVPVIRQKSVGMTEEDDRFTNVEESFDPNNLEEEELEATGSVSEHNSFGGRDTDRDDGSSFGGSPKYFQALSKSISNSDEFFCQSDDEIAFGGSDWNEYLKQNEGGLDSFVELQESKDFLAKPQIGGLSFGKSRGDVDDALKYEDMSESNQPAEETSHVQEAGKLHLDVGDQTVSKGEISPTTTLSVGAISQILNQSLGSGTSMLRQDRNLAEHSSHWEMTSSSEVVSVSEGTYESGVAVQELFEMQSTENPQTLAVENNLYDAAQPVRTRLGPTTTPEATNVDEISGSFFNADTLAVAPVVGVSSSASEGYSEQRRKPLQHELFHAQENSAPVLSSGESLVSKSHKSDFGSGESEEDVQVVFLTPGKTQRVTELPPERPTEDEKKRVGVDWAAEDLGPDELSRYVEALEVKETYIDTVLDMEEVLFDGEGGSGARGFQGGKVFSPGFVRPTRDGSLNASTSSALVSASRLIDHSTCILTDVEWVEIVGAVQRHGGASLGERVVGVKEHTVYRIKVKGGGSEWEIQRRYRDFVALYSQLQSLFPPKKGVSLPSPWEKVKQESRKYFGNTSPDVVEFRSSLIQACLQSLVRAGPPLSTATPLQRFLFPLGEGSQISICSGGPSGSSSLKDHPGPTLPLQELGVDLLKSGISSSVTDNDDDGTQSSVLGKTIRLILQVHKKKSLRQQLQAQHYSCAGCYKHLEPAVGIVTELVQNWGWSGPRLCEYSGQLFCSTCHLNETAVLPAWVLERWDFTPRLVSQLAKAYLDSIYDKPMLCVSAVNPYLYARVPVLAHLTEMRRKISKMLACIRCPARTRIQTMLGSRRYLLENNDFCALRDLVDLSKGAFAVLPGYMRAVLMKVSSHITRECFLCRDLGEACGAREMCEDPYDVIYPHQDELIVRCPKCQQPFHKSCYRKCQKCSSCRGTREQTVTDSLPRIEESGLSLDPRPPGFASKLLMGFSWFRDDHGSEMQH
ncbi:hypothetical protein R1flu_010458 [Riccia fluitans]|uniref:PX domain-containing protein n=1 Tax=Riccia fluitans TaxID=41844 RepID=A0ABD1Z5D2_9MARC